MNHKAFKFLLKPNDQQKQSLTGYFGMTRFIWNKMLEANVNEYQKTKKFIWSQQFQKQIPLLKKEHHWLKEIPSQALQQKCDDLNQALRMTSSKRVKQFGFPKFKSKNDNTQSFRIPQQVGQIKFTNKQIKIPKMGWINWVKHRPLEGKVKSVTIKKEADRYFAIVICELPDAPTCVNAVDTEVVGIDLGVKDFGVTSDGETFETPAIYRKKQKKLKRQQRQLARKQKGSKNREKAKKKLNKTHYKIKCQRHNFTHQLSSQITNDYLFVAVEDLNIQGMIKNRKLSKSIADQGWAMFISQLEYKSKNNGGCTVKIDRFAPSSKTCSSCGNIQEMPLHIRTYNCNSCGFVMDRDHNAAINIKKWGIELINRAGTVRIYACGDTNDGDQAYDWSSYVSMKQEKFFSLEKKPSVL